MQLSELLDDSGFRTGLVVGALALVAIVLVIAVAARRASRRWPDPLPAAGIALVAASLLALERAGFGGLLHGRLVAGLVLLALGPLIAARRASWLTTALATVPGAALVAWAVHLEHGADWVPPVVLVAIVVGGALVADFDRANARAGLGPVLIAVSTIGMYTAIPDTEEIAVVVGVALPLALLGTPRVMASVGRAGASSAVGILVWVAAIGGRGRPGSIVGAIACLGLMLVEPPVRRVLVRRWCSSPTAPISVRTILIVALDLGLVAGTSRVAGLETSGAAAAAIAALALTAAAVVLALLLLPWRRQAPGSRPPPARSD